MSGTYLCFTTLRTRRLAVNQTGVIVAPSAPHVSRTQVAVRNVHRGPCPSLAPKPRHKAFAAERPAG